MDTVRLNCAISISVTLPGYVIRLNELLILLGLGLVAEAPGLALTAKELGLESAAEELGLAHELALVLLDKAGKEIFSNRWSVDRTPLPILTWGWG